MNMKFLIVDGHMQKADVFCICSEELLAIQLSSILCEHILMIQILKYGVATTEDFQAIAESVYGQNLDYFFQEWIYGENEPTYSIGWNKSLVSGDIYDVTLNIYQNVNTNPSYFTMPVQVKLNTSLGDTIVTLFNNAQTQNFQFHVIGNPQSIVFDPGNWILKNIPSLRKAKILQFHCSLVSNKIILIHSIRQQPLSTLYHRVDLFL